jgi:glycosyltransferase AglI
VVIPVRDDPTGVARTLADLHHQSLDPRLFEVWVVDNGSTDATPATARTAAVQGPASVDVIVEARVPTSYGARNAGIRAARGDLVAFLDAGMTVPADYLERVAEAFAAENLDYAGCPVDLTVDRPTVAACHNRLFGFPMAHYLATRQWVGAGCLTVRRAVLDTVGPFDPTLASGGDAEFGRRVAAAGFRQGLLDGVVLSHPARDTVRALTAKTRRTARGKVALAVRDPAGHGAVVRGYASFERLRPLNPAWVRSRLAAASLPATWPRAVGVAALKSWLDIVRLGAATAERVRLRRGRAPTGEGPDAR